VKSASSDQSRMAPEPTRVQPPAVWALGIAGLFGYHALYFAALRLAPPAEAGPPTRKVIAASWNGGTAPEAAVKSASSDQSRMALFGYHALYFAALRLAPPAEAGLISYLWPLLIVLFSALLTRARTAARSSWRSRGGRRPGRSSRRAGTAAPRRRPR
jgi:hypothetical protein